MSTFLESERCILSPYRIENRLKFDNNVIMFLIWRFVKFSNVSDIFLAFKYVWNILTAPFVARRVFLHLFLSRFFWIQPCPLLQTVQADGNSSSILFFVVLREPRMKDAPWLANVAERHKIWLDRGILESIFLFLAQIGVTLHPHHPELLAPFPKCKTVFFSLGKRREEFRMQSTPPMS